MSMGFKVCTHCNDGEAEALYAVGEQIVWYCHECQAEWHDPVEYDTTPDWDDNELRYLN